MPALSRGRHWHIEEIDGERVLCILVRSRSFRWLEALAYLILIPLSGYAMGLLTIRLAGAAGWSLLVQFITIMLLLSIVERVEKTLALRQAIREGSWLHIRSDSVEQWLKGACVWYSDWKRAYLSDTSSGFGNQFELLGPRGKSGKLQPLDRGAGKLLKAAADNFASEGIGDSLSLNEFGPLSSVLDSESRRYSRSREVAQQSMTKGVVIAMSIVAAACFGVHQSITTLAPWGGTNPGLVASQISLWVMAMTSARNVPIWIRRKFFPRDQKLRNHQLVLRQGEWSLHGDGEVIPLGREMQIKGAQVTFHRSDTGENVVLFGKAWMPENRKEELDRGVEQRDGA